MAAYTERLGQPLIDAIATAVATVVAESLQPLLGDMVAVVVRDGINDAMVEVRREAKAAARRAERDHNEFMASETSRNRMLTPAAWTTQQTHEATSATSAGAAAPRPAAWPPAPLRRLATAAVTNVV